MQQIQQNVIILIELNMHFMQMADSCFSLTFPIKLICYHKRAILEFQTPQIKSEVLYSRVKWQYCFEVDLTSNF